MEEYIFKKTFIHNVNISEVKTLYLQYQQTNDKQIFEKILNGTMYLIYNSLKNYYYLKSDGSIDTSSNNSKALRPVMYLKSDVLYQSGNGSFSNPYYIAI